jgi:hypothetical protein
MKEESFGRRNQRMYKKGEGNEKKKGERGREIQKEVKNG